jgi:hypothetical protein
MKKVEEIFAQLSQPVKLAMRIKKKLDLLASNAELVARLDE